MFTSFKAKMLLSENNEPCNNIFENLNMIFDYFGGPAQVNLVLIVASVSSWWTFVGKYLNLFNYLGYYML